MHPAHRLFLSVGICVLVSACQSVAPRMDSPMVPSTHSPLRMCQQPRPEICTQQYEPVCGYGSGHRLLGTYGNACGACGQAEVMGYTEGDCEGKTNPLE